MDVAHKLLSLSRPEANEQILYTSSNVFSSSGERGTSSFATATVTATSTAHSYAGAIKLCEHRPTFSVSITRPAQFS